MSTDARRRLLANGCGIFVAGDVRFGCCFSDVNALNVARVAALMSGIPDTTPAITVNRVCTSGMSCLQDGAIAIGAGLQDCVMVGGVENMSSAPYILPSARWGTRYGRVISEGRLGILFPA